MTNIMLRCPDGRKRRVDVPEDLRPHCFKDFAEGIFKHYREGQDITIEEAARICGVCKETASKYLEAVVKFNFLHLKGPEWQPRKIYRLGCTPPEELLAEAKNNESAAGAVAFRLIERAAGFFRPWYVLLNLELSWEEKLGLIDKWYREEYWPEIHAILGIGIPLSIVSAPIIVNEVQRRWENAS